MFPSLFLRQAKKRKEDRDSTVFPKGNAINTLENKDVRSRDE